jgi:hypothetical protein
MPGSHPLDLPAQRFDQRRRQRRHPIPGTVASAQPDFAPLKIEILHAQRHGFHQAHAGPIQQHRDQPGCAVHLLQHGSDLTRREYHRLPYRRANAGNRPEIDGAWPSLTRGTTRIGPVASILSLTGRHPVAPSASQYAHRERFRRHMAAIGGKVQYQCQAIRNIQ